MGEANQTNRQTEKTEHVVLLVHGIRDFALWQNSIRRTLEQHGFIVEPLNYGRFNLIKFLLPIPFFRRTAIEAIKKQIRIVVQNNPAAQISVIAHSFGTYVVSSVIREEFGMKFSRVIFCGSVVPHSFAYEQAQGRFAAPILNEVGTRDVWPAIAESVTLGYGSAGTYGFRRPLVRDRWHNGAKHGFFLSRDFCAKFWVPFLQDGKFVESDEEPEKTRTWINLLHIFKLKYVLMAGLVASAYFSISQVDSDGCVSIQKNLIQAQLPLFGLGSSQGYAAGNREQWLNKLDGFIVEGNEEFAKLVLELRGLVESAPVNERDGDYNMLVSGEMRLRMDNIESFLLKASVDCGLNFPVRSEP